jgi:hypothetical protein
MSEERKVNLRLALIVLVVANLLFLAYQLFTPDTRETAGSRIDELQINPGRIKLQGVATRGPGGQAASGKGNKGALYRACLEWGPFTGADVGKADSALARLSLPQTPIQRPLSEVGGVKRYAYFVREPDAAIVARIAELQREFTETEIKAGPCPAG